MAMCFLLGFGVFAESASAAKRVAFVVGIDTYDNLGEDDQLRKPVNDAKAISKTLTNIGFEVTEGFNLTIDEFDEKWQKVLNNTTAKDTLLFYFSGHGVEVGGENFLLPRTVPYFEFGRDKRFKRKSISVSDLLDDLKFGDSQTPEVTVMILDACRDNPTIPSKYKKGIGSKGGLIEIPKARGKFLMYAAAPGQVALEQLAPDDKHPNSIYTRTLLPFLEQPNLSIQDLAIKAR